MPWLSFAVEQYEIAPVAIGTPGYPDVSAAIRLRWSGQVRATLWFHRGASALIPPNAAFVAGGATRYDAHFTDDELPDAVDLLRNERPVYFRFNDDTTGAALSTGAERAGEGEGPATPGTADALRDWLLSHPAVAGSIKWQTTFLVSAYDVPEAAKLPWLQWTDTMKAELDAAFVSAWAWLHDSVDPFHHLSEPVPDPPQNLDPHAADDSQQPTAIVGEADAWNLYVRWVAWCLVVEIGAWVPWSVTTDTPEQRQVLFDSAAMMTRIPTSPAHRYVLGAGNPAHPAFVRRKDNRGFSIPAPPRRTAAFVEHAGLRGATRLETIGNLLQWARNHLSHFFGDYTNANMEAHWQYRGITPLSRVIDGTPYAGWSPPFGHWTAGCHGTTAFLRNVLRAVNVPVHIVRICDHSLAHFLTEGRYLDHGDAPYNQTFKATGLPASALLIDEATYTQRFGANPDNHDEPAACPFIGHQVQVLAGP